MVHVRGEDGLDNMPDNIIQIILGYMPFRDVVKTSVLSTEWRNRWKSVPALVFGYYYDWPPSYSYHLHKLVHSALHKHPRHIHKFGLQIREDDCSIWHVMQFLPTSKTHRFTEHEFDLEQHVITPNLYSFENLMHLYLIGCMFDPPPEFAGCRRLISLNLHHAEFDTEALEDFISVCVLLESVTLVSCEWSGIFDFNAPRLKTFKFHGDFRRITFSNTPLLSTVSLSTNSRGLKRFQFVPTIETLHLRSRMLECLDPGNPIQFAERFYYLKDLRLSMFLESINEARHALLLARRCPCLLELQIDLFAGADLASAKFIKFVQDEETPDYRLDHVKRVLITKMCGSASRIEFVKFLLKATTGVEYFFIRLTDSAPPTLEDLLCTFPSASTSMVLHPWRSR